MIVLGLILLVLNALILHTTALYWIGLILLIAGLVLNVVPLGGRSYRVY